jgi:DNA replication protein DnaC
MTRSLFSVGLVSMATRRRRLVDVWYGAIPDPSIADALLDRIVHTAHKIVLRGDSMRKLRAKRGK